MLYTPKLRRDDEMTPQGDYCGKCKQELIDCTCEQARCRFCEEYLDQCVCEKIPPDHSGETLCETCKDKHRCDAREVPGRLLILEAQFYHCHSIRGEADFITDDLWMEV